MKTFNSQRGSYVLQSSEITSEITEIILSNLEYDRDFPRFLKKMTEIGVWVRLNIKGYIIQDYGHIDESYFEGGNRCFCINSTPIPFKEILKYFKEPPKCLRRL